jgi:prefoldin subunit 5
MAAQFADQLQAELDVFQAELERLDAMRRLIEELLELVSNADAASEAPSPARRAALKPA